MKAMVSSVHELLRDDHFFPGLRSANKFEVLETLVEGLRRTHNIPLSAVSRILDAVFREERERASGLPGGIAAPHGQSDVIPASALIIGLAPEGIDFGAPDGSLSHVIVLSLEGKGELPSVCRTAILNLLQGRTDLVQRLSEAETGSTARQMLSGVAQRSTTERE